MPSIINPATTAVKVISADKGIKFYNPQTRQIEEVVAGQNIPANAILEFSQSAELKISLDDLAFIIQGSPETRESIADSLETVTPETTSKAGENLPADYQPLPPLHRISELSAIDFKPARTGGFKQPVIEHTDTVKPGAASGLVDEDTYHTDGHSRFISTDSKQAEQAVSSQKQVDSESIRPGIFTQTTATPIAEDRYTPKATLTGPEGNEAALTVPVTDEAAREQEWCANFTGPYAPELKLVIGNISVVDGTDYVQLEFSVLVNADNNAGICFPDTDGNTFTPLKAPVAQDIAFYHFDISDFDAHKIWAKCTDPTGPGNESIEQSRNGKNLTINYVTESGDNAAKGVVVPADALADSDSASSLSGVEQQPFFNATNFSTPVIDTLAPGAPEIIQLSVNTVVNDFSTSATEFDLMGSAEANSSIQLYNADTDEPIGAPYKVLGNGDWFVPITTAPDEVTEAGVYAIATDEAGNSGSKSAVVQITSDPVKTNPEQPHALDDSINTAPVVTAIEPEPDNTTITDDVVQTFNDTIFNQAINTDQIDTTSTTIDDVLLNVQIDTVDTIPPAILDVALPEGLYKTGDTLEAEVSFNQMMVLGTDKGSPSLVLNIGNDTVTAPLANKGDLIADRSFIFRHVLAEGQNGDVTVKAFKLNGATLTDIASSQSFDEVSYQGSVLQNVQVDARAPALEKIDADTFGYQAGTAEPAPDTTVRIKDIVHQGGPKAYQSGDPNDVSDDKKSGDLVKVKVIFTGTVEIGPDVLLAASVNNSHKFMKPAKQSIGKGSEFTFMMRTSDQLVGDGFKIPRFKKDAQDKVTSPDGYKVDLKLPQLFHFKDATFNIEKSAEEQQPPGQIAQEQVIIDKEPAPVIQSETTEPVPNTTVQVSNIVHLGGPKSYKSGDPTDASDDKQGDLVKVKVSFSGPVLVGPDVRLLATVDNSPKFMKRTKQATGEASEFTFVMRTSDALAGNNGFKILRFNKGAQDQVISSEGHKVDLKLVQPFHFSDATFNSEVKEKDPGINVDSSQPQITDFAIESKGGKTTFTKGDTLVIEARLSCPVFPVAVDNTKKPYLELQLNHSTFRAYLDENKSSAHSLKFGLELNDQTLVATRGVKITSVNLNGANFEDSAGHSLNVEGISSTHLPITVQSPYPSLVSAEGAHISADSIMVTGTKTTLTMETPAGVDNIQCRPRKEMAFRNWSAPTSGKPEVLQVNGKNLLKFDLFKSMSNKWLFTYKCSITDASGEEMSQLYKVGYMMPSHHYNFDALWTKGGASQSVPSMSYLGEQTRAIVESHTGNDIAQVRSESSTGQALQLNGGALRLDDMSKVFKGDFTVCSRIQTTVTGSGTPSQSPSLIGKDNETDGMFLFTVHIQGHIVIALGNRYGAMTSQPVNDGEDRYICVSRELKTDESGTISTTAVYVNGVAEGKPVDIYHKGHAGLVNDPNAPEAQPDIDLNIIGYTAHEDTQSNIVPFTGIIDDLEITPFTMTGQQIADSYTCNLHLPMATEDFYPGRVAAVSRPQLSAVNGVKMTFHHAMKEETMVKNGKEITIQKEVQDSNPKFECASDDTAALNNRTLVGISSVPCKVLDSDVSSYRLSFDDSSKGDVPEASLLIGNSKGSGLYFDGVVHDGPSQTGNSIMEPKSTPDYFIAEKSAVLDNVGAEDLVILDAMPEMRDLLGKETPAGVTPDVESALNELVHCTHSTVKVSQDTAESDSAASLAINTLEPGQPVTAYLAGELYTINPDHIV